MQLTASEEFIKLVNLDFYNSKDYPGAWTRTQRDFPTIYARMNDEGTAAVARQAARKNKATFANSAPVKAREAAEKAFVKEVHATMSRLNIDYTRAWEMAKTLRADLANSLDAAYADETRARAEFANAAQSASGMVFAPEHAIMLGLQADATQSELNAAYEANGREFTVPSAPAAQAIASALAKLAMAEKGVSLYEATQSVGKRFPRLLNMSVTAS